MPDTLVALATTADDADDASSVGDDERVDDVQPLPYNGIRAYVARVPSHEGATGVDRRTERSMVENEAQTPVVR